jgi:hypothetical protein
MKNTSTLRDAFQELLFLDLDLELMLDDVRGAR